MKAASKFHSKVVVSWSIIYDNDPGRTYHFDNFDKVISSVESSIRGYVGDCKDTENAGAFKIISAKLIDDKLKPIIPIQINDLLIVVYRWELDRHHKIHSLLCDMYDASPNKAVAASIIKMFDDPT